MQKKQLFETICKSFIEGAFPKETIKELVNNITAEDLPWLVEKVIELKDPSDYFSGSEKRDEKAIAGFFLIIDYISFLIISMGTSAIKELEKYQKEKSTYLPWVIKYVGDERFRNSLLEKF